MEEKRTLRKNGSAIVLGQTEYRIDGVACCGGSSIVYKASFEDGPNRGQRSGVFIKELYPQTADGSVFRDGACNICCKRNAKGFFERSREYFLKGNEANLAHLGKNPEKISGNINSFEAFGTYYSVFSMSGGRSLQDLLGTENLTLSLRRTAELLIMVLDALESFHSAGILHLDIRPDNILMFPSYALLIDCSSVWTESSNAGEFIFSDKSGYVSPEVRLKEVSNIGTASDLYSVNAIFFRMITGRRLMREETAGAWKKALSQSLPVFEDAPPSAVRKAMQILQRGLHVLSRKRYRSTAQMKEDLEELILRFDRKGVTAAALWEGSFSGMKKYAKAKPGNMYLEREILTDSGDSFSERGVFEALSDGSLILLSGPGGMGKTSFLMKVWKENMSVYKEKAPVIFYVPLYGYQQAGEEAYYIHKYLIRHIILNEDEAGTDICIQELDRLFEDSLSRRWIFLLDGINEAGTKTDLLLKEIEELGSKAGTGMIVTDRTDRVSKYGLRFFAAARLLPLSETAVTGCLERSGIACPKNTDDLDALKNPLLLSLYMKTAEMNGECGGIQEELPGMSAEDITGRYMETLCRMKMRKDSGDEKLQLRHKYILEHLLPEIAVSMKLKGRTVFGPDELSGCLKNNFRTLRNRNFAKAFPEYLRKSRLMLEDIADEREWSDYAVNGELVREMGLLEETPGFGCKFVHDDFIDVLAVRGKENRAEVNKYKRRSRIKYITAAAVVIVLACAAAIVF